MTETDINYVNVDDEDNRLYTNLTDSLEEKVFDVYTEPFECKKTPPSFGKCLLAINDDCLELRSKDSSETFIKWPIVYIRRFGYSERGLHLEAGRRCESGEGQFIFLTAEGHRLHEELRLRICRKKAFITSSNFSK